MAKVSVKKSDISEIILIFIVLILALLFRIYKLRTAPDWFIDEGEFTRLADYLSKGNFDFLGIRNSMLLIGRPPVYLWILAGLIKLFGTDILILRSLSAACSMVTVIISYILVRRAVGRKSAFYAAILLAIMPEFIFYNRMGFSYNWTSLWIFLSVYTLWEYHMRNRQRWLVAACLMAGIAFASDYIGVVSIFVIIIVLLFFRPKYLWMTLIMGIPLVISLIPTFSISPGTALNNLIASFSIVKRVEGNISYQFSLMLQAYPEMFQRQPWIILGIIGVFILPDKRLRGLFLLELVGIFTVFSFSKILAMQYLLTIWPFVLIGLGYFLEKMVTYIFTNIKSSLLNLSVHYSWFPRDPFRSFFGAVGSTYLAFTFIFLPISYLLILDMKGFLIEPVNPASTMIQVGWQVGYVPASDAEAVAQAISHNTKPTDFVIAPGVVSWMLPCNAADIRSVYTYDQVAHSKSNRYLNLDDYVVNSALTNAKFVVIDNTWIEWKDQLSPEAGIWLDEVRQWPLVLERGTLQLFCNPIDCE